jgi:uncharacterized 2Fe-2S/4Fe-4S cluster protein (DUF4445 family)
MKNIIIKFYPDKKEITVKRSTSLLDSARRAGVKLESLCGGEGICGKCKVVIEKGTRNLSKLTNVEKSKLSDKEISRGYRLACCSLANGNLTVRVPEESRGGTQRVLIEGVETFFEIDPVVEKIFLKLPKPSLQNQKSDFERLGDCLKEEHGLGEISIPLSVMKQLPSILRKSNWETTVTIWGEKKIIRVEPRETLARNYGIALDIGTTTVVGYLVDLNTGKLLEASSILNPQVKYGEDVMTRITFAIQDPDGLKKLNESIIWGVNGIVRDVCSKAHVKSEEISELTVVGNTAMHHLFLGLCPKYLGLSPFTPVIQNPVDIEARNLGIDVNPVANVHILPVIACFVGADNVGVILATQINESSKPVLAIDIGTNGEIALGNRDSITACSCAAGPALEGTHIKFGMRATEGAIEKVKIDPSNLEVKYSTIGDAKARGLCGSGIVDAVAELFKAGVILRNGRINLKIEDPHLRTTKEGNEFILARGNETATGEEIKITQKDIREVQLAKAAIYAGASILMERHGVGIREIDSLLLAGAFGSSIDKWSAKVIGLYPDVPLDRVKTVGNAAGAGAKQALISSKKRMDAEIIAKNVHYLELTIAPEFKDEFISAMYFPHSDINRFPSMRKLYEKLPIWSEILKS